MSDDSPSSQLTPRSWLDRLIQSFSNNEPRSREELMEIIKEAANNKLMDQEALNIIEGALDVANLQVREIMVPRSQMVVVKSEESAEEFLPKVIESGHSRFPVIGDSLDDIKGVLLAKDLLPLILHGTENFSLSSILRPANIIPESKRLNILLNEFRENRYHMALVIDEFGSISGLLTIEDILEEIVGDIDYVLKALTAIEDFNEHFGTQFSDDEFDTLGGLLTQAFGHIPTRNETIELNGFTFRILYADSRQIHLIRLTTPVI
jgi:magnesium and cobalt transporter